MIKIRKTKLMKTDEIVDLISDHLQEANSDRPERLSRIKEMLDFLNFNLRFTELTDEEQVDFVMTEEGTHPWTKEMRKKFDNATKEHQHDYIDMLARSNYFRLCAWRSYLFGETKDKPSILKIAS